MRIDIFDTLVAMILNGTQEGVTYNMNEETDIKSIGITVIENSLASEVYTYHNHLIISVWRKNIYYEETPNKKARIHAKDSKNKNT